MLLVDPAYPGTARAVLMQQLLMQLSQLTGQEQVFFRPLAVELLHHGPLIWHSPLPA